MIELGHIEVACILRLRDVKKITGLSRSTIYAYMADGHFPKKVSLGPRAVGWRSSDVLEWLQSRTNVIEFPEKQRRKK